MSNESVRYLFVEKVQWSFCWDLLTPVSLDTESDSFNFKSCKQKLLCHRQLSQIA